MPHTKSHAIRQHLEVGLAGEPLVLQNLNPISIRIRDECNVLHLALIQPLLEWHVEAAETLTRRIEVVDSNSWATQSAQCHLD